MQQATDHALFDTDRELTTYFDDVMKDAHGFSVMHFAHHDALAAVAGTFVKKVQALPPK
jgi:hypothetical protein